MARLDQVRALAASETGLCVVSTTRDDGSPHATVVNAGVLPHPTQHHDVVGFVVRGNARKLDHFRRTGRCAVTFRRSWSWAGVEGRVDIVGPDDTAEGLSGPAFAQLLRDVFTAAGGTHDDWDEYDRVMRRERRAVVLVHPDRVSGR
jgi:PPOX class probable F420-dependent enzyme